MTKGAHTNSERIEWLEDAYSLLRKFLLSEAPKSLTITFAFPTTRATSGKVLGQYHHDALEGFDGDSPLSSGAMITLAPNIFDNPSRVLDVLLHEMIHSVAVGDGHRGRFIILAKRCGLEGKMTATVAGEWLEQQLKNLLTHLAPMPKGFGSLSGTDKKKQTTRMRKYKCPGCDQIIRAASETLQISCIPCTLSNETAIVYEIEVK